jgi:hypothetical protein
MNMRQMTKAMLKKIKRIMNGKLEYLAGLNKGG